MKHFLLLFILLCLGTSCKKAYNCSCMTTIIYPSGDNDSYNSSTTKVNAKLSKKQAKSMCEREEDVLDELYLDIYTNNGSWSSHGFSASTSCKLIE